MASAHLIDAAPRFPDYVVKMSMYKHNRERLYARFKNVATTGIILCEGGQTKERYDTDTEILFRQESNFSYLFGVQEADFMGGIQLDTGKSFLLMPRLPESYAVWLGTIHPPEFYKAKYEVDEVYYVDELPALVKKWDTKNVYTLRHYAFAAIENFKLDSLNVDREKLKLELEECRLIKSEEELNLMRHVNRISCWAHTEVMKHCRPGMSEHELEALFLYLCYKHGRCRHMSYMCICAAGKNAGTLHYPNNDKLVRDADLVLLDMGAELHCYCSDITNTFPANGKFTAEQRAIYEIVLQANRAVQQAMRPGVDWTDMHRLAERVICEGLVKLDIIRGELAELQASHIPALFFPHGLGHLLGLDTHEPGGYPPGVQRIAEPGIRYLRTRRVLQAGMVITVEPGLYFIDANLDPALADPQRAKFLNAERLAKFRNMGGVRIEDDVIVTATGCENMTQIPRTVEEIEAAMAEGRRLYHAQPGGEHHHQHHHHHHPPGEHQHHHHHEHHGHAQGHEQAKP